MKRKVCVITGARSEYGLLKPLFEGIKQDSKLTLQVIASGAHLSKAFGLTYKEIEKDGFEINEKVKVISSSDNAFGVSEATGSSMKGFAKAYSKLKPDIIVAMGDRYEIFGAVAAALINQIPVAHLSGGELTEGANDDAFRHSITKMSHLHFTSMDEYRKRVIQLGENPKTVFNVGEVGLDNLNSIQLMTRQELEDNLQIKLKKRNILVTYHPETLEEESLDTQLENLLDVLDDLEDTFIIFTKANADAGGRYINERLAQFVQEREEKSAIFDSLGQKRYLSLLKVVDAMVGNSSSGLVEAPSFKTPVINIGDRQKGRVKAKSVIDCRPTKLSIKKAFGKLNSVQFKKELKKVRNPYGDGQSTNRILKVLRDYDLKGIVKKKFYDVRVK